jgi:uncharacterized protein (DUF3084 family)
MHAPSIGARVEEQVKARVDALVAQKEQLKNSVLQLEQKQRDLLVESSGKSNLDPGCGGHP